MKKVSIIYFSSTGNTESMAEAIAEGVRTSGGEPSLVDVESASIDSISNADAVALGCPAMGSEELDYSMETFVDSIESAISGKNLALFGSYDWGDGEWMKEWFDKMKGFGANIIQDEGLMVSLTPEDDDIEKCKDLGKKLAE